jgi:creatinine amidohydrolase/Fe(II)-dependent formamide hydrolase-like protein
VYLEDLTWMELRDQVRAGKTTVIVPIGGTEQNGPHMALGKHNARAKVLAGRIATELGNAIVAPVIAYVPEGTIEPPSEHMKYPGTITTAGIAFEKTLEYAARSFRLHGFKDVVFLGDHGGYQKNQRAVATRLNREWAGKPARAHSIDEYYTAAAIKGHADRDDTSLTLALVPEMVHAERIGAAGADGVQGDARGASAKDGEKMAKAIVDRSVEAIRKAVRR